MQGPQDRRTRTDGAGQAGEEVARVEREWEEHLGTAELQRMRRSLTRLREIADPCRREQVGPYSAGVDNVALTPDEAAAVLRRAAEIQSADLGRDEPLDAAAVVQLGGELGLHEDAVRAALAESRRPSTSPPAAPVLLGLDAQVLVRRQVEASCPAVQAHFEQWLRRQWLQRQRTSPRSTTWRPRRGPVADLRRGLDVLRTIELKGVGAVEVHTEPEGSTTHVTVSASLSGARAEALGLLVALPTGAVGGMAVLAGLLGAPEALLALPLAGAAGGAGWLGARAVVATRKRQVREALEGVLDGLTPA